MRWFRSQRLLWGLVALLALTLQLGFSFGHVHGAYADHPTAALAAAAETGNVTAYRPDTDDSNDSGYCATCAILALLTGAQTASTPAVAHPVAPVSAEIVITGEALRIASCHVAFRSRAPPLS